MSPRPVVNKMWLTVPPVLFACAGACSLALTEFIMGIRPQMLWTWPVFVSCTLPPMLASWGSIHAWLNHGNRFLAGWLSVAMTAWLSLVVNPIIWFLVLSTLLLFGVVVLSVFLATGSLLAILWAMLGSHRHTRCAHQCESACLPTHVLDSEKNENPGRID